MKCKLRGRTESQKSHVSCGVTDGAPAASIKAGLDGAVIRIANRDAINPNWDKLSAADFQAMTEEIERRDAPDPGWY
jgi:hypothetical protein